MSTYAEHTSPVTEAIAEGRKVTLMLADYSEIAVTCETADEAELIEAIFRRSRRYTVVDTTAMEPAL